MGWQSVKRKVTEATALIFFAILGTAAVAWAAGSGAAQMMLSGGSLGGVSFPHHRHQEALGACDTCHSLFPQTAGAIRDLIGRKKMRKREVMDRCRGCHQALASAAKRAGPTQCSGCHHRK